MDAFATTFTPAATLTFDLCPPKPNKSSVGLMAIPLSFIKIAQVINEIFSLQDLTSMACFDLDLLPLTFDLQNVIRSSVEAIEYSLSVLSKLFKPFMRYHGNNI